MCKDFARVLEDLILVFEGFLLVFKAYTSVPNDFALVLENRIHVFRYFTSVSKDFAFVLKDFKLLLEVSHMYLKTSLFFSCHLLTCKLWKINKMLKQTPFQSGFFCLLSNLY